MPQAPDLTDAEHDVTVAALRQYAKLMADRATAQTEPSSRTNLTRLSEIAQSALRKFMEND